MDGRPFSPDAADFFEEGIRLPILKLYKASEPNQDVLDIIATSVRVPDKVHGDIQGLVAANDVMAPELLTFMDEYELDNLTGLAKVIHNRSKHGGLGRPGAVIGNDKPVIGNGKLSLNPGQRLVLETPGGGGLRSPANRVRHLVAQDIRRWLVSMEQAFKDYGYGGIEAAHL